MYTATQKVIDLGDGRQIEIETGKLAKQADGSVVVKQGNTMLLATVVAAKDAKEGTDFMPLQVEYKEKYASAGRFPGGFLKREARPSDYMRMCSSPSTSYRPKPTPSPTHWPVWRHRRRWPYRTYLSAVPYRRCVSHV